MKILLTGASGFLGAQIQQALEKLGHEVVPIARRYGYDFNHLQTVDKWLPLLQGVNVVINAAGIIIPKRKNPFLAVHYAAPSALFKACLKSNVTRVVQISALGADENATNEFLLSKRAVDDELRQSELDWFVLRPSLIYGEGGYSSRFFNKLASYPCIAVIDQGQQLIQPIHCSDVVLTVLQCLESSSAQLTIDVVGPKSITYINWLQKIRQSQGRSAAYVVKIPYRFVLSWSQLAQHIHPIFRPDNIKMLKKNSIADVSKLTKFNGQMPKTFEEIV